MLIDKEIEIIVNNRYIKYYKDKGYNTNNKKLLIRIEDLPDNSHYEVNVKCDSCNLEKSIKYFNYINNVKKNNKYICNNCKGISIISSNIKKYGVKSTLDLKDVKEKAKKL